MHEQPGNACYGSRMTKDMHYAIAGETTPKFAASWSNVQRLG